MPQQDGRRAFNGPYIMEAGERTASRCFQHLWYRLQSRLLYSEAGTAANRSQELRQVTQEPPEPGAVHRVTGSGSVALRREQAGVT